MTWHDDHKDARSFGAKAADALRNGMGSWFFIIATLAAMVGWIVTLGFGIDNQQLTILNLGLSCMAALQGSIILISAKRQDALAAEMAQHDYQTNLDSKEEIGELHKILINQTAILQELKTMPHNLRAIHEKDGDN
jgi:uncharacterized membrane protein